jgi:serine/threonine protein kinase
MTKEHDKDSEQLASRPVPSAAERYQRVCELFDAVQKRPSDDAATFLREACGDTPDIMSEVLRMLGANIGETCFDTPLVEHPEALFVSPSSSSAAADPEYVGPYGVIRKVGEGGYAEVFLCQESEPVQREVAVKVLKAGLETKAFLSRFEAERRALSLMSHPNIAMILGSGKTREGRPYIVMEYVPGTPITEHCDRHRLSLESRLALFSDVCRAVQYAHDMGVVHRDLKPSNILVARVSERNVPKIIDFGILKAMRGRLGNETIVTNEGAPIGTPEYMSPEQFDPGVGEVDARADIYGLGVVLYELMTGVLPFPQEAFRGKPFAEVHRIATEEEARGLVARLDSLVDPADRNRGVARDGLAADSEVARTGATGTRPSSDRRSIERIAQARQESPTTLRKSLRGEIEWITLCAIKKQKSERYDSASEFIRDIEQFLHDRPLLKAKPTSRWQFLGRSLFRRKVSLLATTIAVGLGVFIAPVLVALAIRLAPAIWQKVVGSSTSFVSGSNAGIEAAIARFTQATAALAERRYEDAGAALREVPKGFQDASDYALLSRLASRPTLAFTPLRQPSGSSAWAHISRGGTLGGFLDGTRLRATGLDGGPSMEIELPGGAVGVFATDSFVAGVSAGGRVERWDAGRSATEQIETGAPIIAAFPSADRSRLLLLGAGNQFKQVELAGLEQTTWRALGTQGEVRVGAISDDGKTCCAFVGSNSGSSGRVIVWDSDSGGRFVGIERSGAPIGLWHSRMADAFVAVYEDSNLEVISTRDGRFGASTRVGKREPSGAATCADLSPGGDLLVLGYESGAIECWAWSAGASEYLRSGSYESPGCRIVHVAVALNAECFATYDGAGQLACWTSPNCGWTPANGLARVRSYSLDGWKPTGGASLSCTDYGLAVCVVRDELGKLGVVKEHPLPSLLGGKEGDSVKPGAVSSSGSALGVGGSRDGGLGWARVVALPDLREELAIDLPSPLERIAISRGGDVVATLTEAGELTVRSTGLWTLQDRLAGVNCVLALDQAVGVVVSATSTGRVEAHAVDGGENLWSIDPLSSAAEGTSPTRLPGVAAFAPNGGMLAIGWTDGRLTVAKVGSGNELDNLQTGPGVHGKVTALAWADDGSMLIAGHSGGRVNVWLRAEDAWRHVGMAQQGTADLVTVKFSGDRRKKPSTARVLAATVAGELMCFALPDSDRTEMRLTARVGAERDRGVIGSWIDSESEGVHLVWHDGLISVVGDTPTHGRPTAATNPVTRKPPRGWGTDPTRTRATTLLDASKDAVFIRGLHRSLDEAIADAQTRSATMSQDWRGLVCRLLVAERTGDESLELELVECLINVAHADATPAEYDGALRIAEQLRFWEARSERWMYAKGALLARCGRLREARSYLINAEGRRPYADSATFAFNRAMAALANTEDLAIARECYADAVRAGARIGDPELAAEFRRVVSKLPASVTAENP